MIVKTHFAQNKDGREAFRVLINNKLQCSFVDGESEDNSLCRNFEDVFGIPRIIRMAYNAGRNGEDLEFIDEDFSWENFFDELS